MGDPDRNKTLVLDYIAAICRCDVQGARGLVNADFTHRLMGSAMAGEYGLEKFFTVVKRLEAVVRGIKLDVVAQVAEGQFVVTRATSGMTTVTGEPYPNHYVFWAEVHDGKLSRVYEYMDSQLGNDVLGPLFLKARAAHA